jgi:GDP-D-mannose 3', 5'-epimerase
MVRRACVTGAGGFIGHHLVAYLKSRHLWVRGVDVKHPEYAESPADEFQLLDLRCFENCVRATAGVHEIYALAADMGGIGYITTGNAAIYRNNSLIDINTLEAARINGVDRYFFASSACVYPRHRQLDVGSGPLKECDAYPADPDSAYGWEKLTIERLCADYQTEYGMTTRIARLHNIFGPLGTWSGGREKAPAALCRKIAEAKLSGISTVEIWGDGEQRRSFCHIDDCTEGVCRLMQGDCSSPVNLGQDRSLSIDELTTIIASIAKYPVERLYTKGPQGVRGRNSDNALLRQVLSWEPRISVEDGLRETYFWIEDQVRKEQQCGSC